MKAEHFVRYGTAAEQRFMRECQHCFDAVTINGSMLAHISKSISMFVHRDIITKEFFIDPMTHSFQHELEKIENSDGNIRSSIKKLVKVFGEPISVVLSKGRPVKDVDFTKNKSEAFVERVLDFQYNHITKYIDDEYRDYIEYKGIDKQRKPIFLIAPYFFLTENTIDIWNGINAQMLKISLEKKGDFDNTPIFAQLVFDRSLLKKGRIRKLVGDYSAADGLLYWVDGFNEAEATTEELRLIRDFVRTFKQKANKPLINLYGGYFSELLMKDGLDGVVHGLEYGEMREVVPVGGGIPLSKYYLPALKKRIPANQMVRLLRTHGIDSPRKFHREICDCPICKGIIKDDNIAENFNNFIKSKPVIIKYRKSGNVRMRSIDFPERESKELCLRHYLEAKGLEFKNIKKKNRTELVQDLDRAFDKYKTFFSDGAEIRYLKNWSLILSD